ncbi:MAG: PspC domain-containing protein [Prevotella sp.]|jgi:phage shock protein PspC (stress-responsive transcriptional regulator)|nr:PspC domain-containing protein [Prevotella sp.]
MTKRLYRSDDRVIAGVCSGIAEYLDFDPVAVRLGYAFLTLATCFSGVLFYIVAWIVMPEKNRILPPQQ